jgi:alkylation response protein AidB-like acyl-CoA dehydrogenase
MDFEFTAQQEQFRQEVREFFHQEEEDVRGAREEWDGGQGFGPHSWTIIGKIGARGWLCPTWPRKYGGLELSFIYRYIIMEQMHHFLNCRYGGAGHFKPWQRSAEARLSAADRQGRN